MVVTSVKIQNGGKAYFVNGKTSYPTDNLPVEVKEWLSDPANTQEVEFTAKELADKATADKWEQVAKDRSMLTVTTTVGNKFAANQYAITCIYRKEASMGSTDSCTWYEDWGSFTVTKVELQEALNLANAADQNLLDTLLV